MIVRFVINRLYPFHGIAFMLWVFVCIVVVWSANNRASAGVLTMTATVLLGVAVFIGGFMPYFDAADTYVMEGKSYHVNYVFDGLEGYGYYNLLECDTIGLFCRRLHKTDSRYNSPYPNAHIELDESIRVISLIIEDENVYELKIE